MPLYDYQCSVCGTPIEVFFKIDEKPESIPCSNCNGLMYQIISSFHRDWFRPHWNENFTNKPVFVESKEHMKKLCKQYGVYARCLM